ncbi:serine/threonine-protein kinase NIM1-like [Oratosquilla oratoria]|uniref:serine/threonine-protein kinase NIM1-like n=1 Tax=Oratosquilla oratoria TaxID=337810 RepID=UPI003F776946
MPAASLHHLGADLRQSASSKSLASYSSVTICDHDDRTPYERLLYGLHHDQRWLKEVTLGRRVGFYRFRGELGQGNFSTVKLAYHQLTHDKVAVKVIEKAKLDQKTQRMLAREIANMDAVNHPCLIRLFEVVETLSRIHLVLEYAHGGELFNKVTAEGRLEETSAAHLYAQILGAITHLHGLSIIHRDIKAENVFFAGPNTVKVGDFGFSTRVSALEQQLSTFCGSPPYAAPELYKDESYVGPAVDVWALGVLLFFMLTADMPFKASTVGGLKRYILDGRYEMPEYLTAEAKNVISRILVQTPSERLSLQEITTHPWVALVAKPPPPFPSYVSFPRLHLDTNERTPQEEEALAGMAKYGITDEMVRDGTPLGARSPSISTYRILMHRIILKEMEKNETDSAPSKHVNAESNSGDDDGNDGSGGDSSKGQNGKAVANGGGFSCDSSPRKLKERLKNGFSSPVHHVKSKACIIV